MIQIVFSIKFQSQLRRTRRYVFDSLEKTIINGAETSGGKTRRAFHCIIAEFDESALSFWVDILTCIETVNKAIAEVSNDLYGYVCLIGTFDDDDVIPQILRSIPSDGKASGIWCTDYVRRALSYFAMFCEQRREVPVSESISAFSELDTVKPFEFSDTDDALYAKMHNVLARNMSERILFCGPSCFGKRQRLRRFCSGVLKDMPVLSVRFASQSFGITAFVDAYTPEMRAFVTQKSTNITSELESLYEQLARERPRTECSRYTLQKAHKFFHYLLHGYCDAVQEKNVMPIMLFEEMQNAPEHIIRIICEVCEKKNSRYRFAIFGTCSDAPVPEQSAKIWTRIIDVSDKKAVRKDMEELSPSLWEAAYACKLFYRYFPPYMVTELFQEQGKNAHAIRRTFELLLEKNVIRALDDPEPVHPDFLKKAEAFLGDRCLYIREKVRNALLLRLQSGKLSACYNLLEALHELGGGISDSLAMEAVRADIVNRTYSAIETALQNGAFTGVVGEERGGALYYYYQTMKSLLFDNEETIKETFKSLKPEESHIGLYRSQMFTIEASYKMGIHDTNAALLAIKEAMVISQNSGRYGKNAGIYRLFSLVNLSKKELSDALDYLSFAVDDAEKSKDLEELTVSAYYAANAYFIYGNLSKADRLIRQAEQTARLAGRWDWILRAKFVQGRFYFEMGRYQEARAIFVSLIEKKRYGDASPFAATVRAWLYRTELYLYEAEPARPPVCNADTRLFEVEAAYLTGDYQKAVERAEAILQDLPEDKFLYLEQPDWESGFSQCELLEFTHKEFWTRMCTVWNSLSLCRLDDTTNEEAIRAMGQIMRDERFSDYDPNAPFYFFANFRVLTESSSSEVDRNTAISMAFKRLQRRAGRIDDIETRRSFLAHQYWNKILFNTAKEYKLI